MTTADTKPIVLDAGALLSGQSYPLNLNLITSPRVFDEVGKGRPSRQLAFLAEGGLETISPDESFINEVKDAMTGSGDVHRLSTADVEILALAKQTDGILLTDDYSIQNVAALMKVEYRSIQQEPIKKIISWTIRCKGCGRIFEKMFDDCPVCGHELRTVPKK